MAQPTVSSIAPVQAMPQVPVEVTPAPAAVSVATDQAAVKIIR